MIPVLLTLVTLPACAEPVPAPDPLLVQGIRQLAGEMLNTTSQNLDILSDPRVFCFIESGDLALRISSAVRAAEETETLLAKLTEMKGLAKADAAALARLRKIADSIKQQAASLQAYWDSGVVDHWKKSEKAGLAARTELDDVLDLKPKKGIAPPPREPGKKP